MQIMDVTLAANPGSGGNAADIAGNIGMGLGAIMDTMGFVL